MNKRSIAIARAVAVIGGTGALIIGATFAAAVGTVDLTGNTFSASQGIQISLDNINYGNTVGGFDFGTTPIGNAGSVHQLLYLKDVRNGATTPLALSVAAANCNTFTGLDGNKVHVNIKRDSSSTTDSPTMAALCTGSVNLTNPANSPATGGVGKYDVWVTLDANAITGSPSSATNHFDLDFTGTE